MLCQVRITWRRTARALVFRYYLGSFLLVAMRLPDSASGEPYQKKSLLGAGGYLWLGTCALPVGLVIGENYGRGFDRERFISSWFGDTSLFSADGSPPLLWLVHERAMRFYYQAALENAGMST